ncbi:MAG: protein kinase [Planctomycetales bacterium]|nr:protein kinase [Planctomycetales bacterium]
MPIPPKKPDPNATVNEPAPERTLDDSAARRRAAQYLGEESEGTVLPDVPEVEATRARGTLGGPDRGPGAAGKPVLRKLGAYALHREAGRGAMGVVYEATDTSEAGSGRRVAVKVLPPQMADSKDARERFVREGSAMAKLRHPNILPVYGMGEQEGILYYAMAFVSGRSLKDILDSEALPFTDAARYVKAAAEALHYAHEQGVIHRDVKPANIMLDQDGTVLLADFGIAKSEDQATLTASGTVMGTPMYMSPEQALGQTSSLDGRSDVYSLGATLYEAITRAKPYVGEDVRTILRHVVETEPVLPRRINKKVPRGLEAVALQAMEKQKHRRYGDAGLMAEDLGRFLGGEPVRAKTRGPIGRALRWAGRHKAAAALLFVLVFGSAGGAGAVAWTTLERQRQVRAALDQAAAALAAGRLDEADTSTGVAESLSPGNPEAAAGREAARAKRSEMAEIRKRDDERRAAELARSEAEARTREGTQALAPAETALRGPAALAPDSVPALLAAIEAAAEKARTAAQRDPAFAGAHALRLRAALARARLEVRRERYDDARGTLALARDAAGSGGGGAEEVASLERVVEGTGSLALETDPAGAEAVLLRAAPDTGVFQPEAKLGKTPLPARPTAMGSYLLVLRREGHAEARLPFVVERNEEERLSVPLVPLAEVPDGMVHVPAGESVLGDSLRVAPRRERFPALLADRTEVTREGYAAFLRTLPLEEAKKRSPRKRDGTLLWTLETLEKVRAEDGVDVPVVFVSWEDAQAYAGWRGARIPTGPEWERLARGADGREFPWGRRFDAARANFSESAQKPRIRPASALPEGESPFGLLNLAGNAAEFTATVARERGENMPAIVEARGGGAGSNAHDLLAAVPMRVLETYTFPDVGIRCVKDLPARYQPK